MAYPQFSVSLIGLIEIIIWPFVLFGLYRNPYTLCNINKTLIVVVYPSIRYAHCPRECTHGTGLTSLYAKTFSKGIQNWKEVHTGIFA